jgi:hypothetical protein
MFAHHSAHAKIYFNGSKEKVCVGFQPRLYPQRKKMQSEIKKASCAVLPPIGIQTFIVKYIRAAPFQNFPLSPSLPKRQSL